MKIVLLLLTVLATQMTSAEVRNSNYEARHLTLIEKSIQEKCGIPSELSQLSSTETIVNVDQGIQDVYFKTVLQGFMHVDQMLYDEYEITVESVLADMYDHDAQTWGTYSVEAVKCDMK